MPADTATQPAATTTAAAAPRAKRLPSVPAVAMLVPEFPSQSHAPFWLEANAWRDAGATVDLLSTRRPSPDACRQPFAERAREETYYAWRPSAGATVGGVLLSPRRLRAGLAYVRSLRERSLKGRLATLGLLAAAAEVVGWCRDRNVRHLHCHSFADAAHLCRLAQLFGGPTYSLTLHAELPVFGTDHKRKLSGCSAVSVVGEHLVSQVADLGFPRERILANWAGIDTARFAPAGDDAAEQPTSGTLRVITVADLEPPKGHRFAIAALGRLAKEGVKVEYTLVGDGEGRAALRDEARAAGLNEAVRMIGPLGEDDLARELARHDVFCLPRVGLGESGPTELMEAMASGLPGVVSRIGSTTDLLHDGVDGFLVAQEDVDALTDRFRRLAGDLELRRRIGTAAREKAVAEFDVRRTALRLFGHVQRWTPETFGT